MDTKLVKLVLNLVFKGEIKEDVWRWSLFLFILLLFVLSLEKTVCLLDLRGCLPPLSFDEFPLLPSLPVSFEDSLLSLPLLFDFCEMSFQVVQLISHFFKLFGSIVLTCVESYHIFVVRGDHFDQLGLVSKLIVFGLRLLLCVLVSKFLQFLLLSVNLRF